MRSLKDELAVVTGASSGIGRASSLALAKEGAEVCLVSRRRDALDVVAREAEAHGARTHVRPTDLTRDEDITALTQGIQRDFQSVDVLILCGGAISHGPLGKAPLSDFDLMYRSNLLAHYALTKALLPALRKGPGQIVFINSSASLRSPANV